MQNNEMITAILARSGHAVDLDRMFPDADTDEIVCQLGTYLAATIVSFWMVDAEGSGQNRYDQLRGQLPEWAVREIDKGGPPELISLESAIKALEDATMQRDWACLGEACFPVRQS